MRRSAAVCSYNPLFFGCLVCRMVRSTEEIINEKLGARFEPLHLAVENESGSHNVPQGSETHFRVVLVSDAFEGQRLLARHRAVNEALAEELDGGVHALALHTYTPGEWRDRFGDAPMSPPCLGGKAQETPV